MTTTTTIHGSALTTPATARDVDVIYVGDRDEAERAARAWATAHASPAPDAPARTRAPAPEDAAVTARLTREEAAAYAGLLRERRARHAQRAADLADAVLRHDALAELVRAAREEGREVSPDDVSTLSTLRARIHALRPYALRWWVEHADAALVSLETFDFAEDCITVGAHAIIDPADPAALRAECREVTHETGAGWRSEAEREDEHRAAALRLCEANEWGATVERSGERWEP